MGHSNPQGLVLVGEKIFVTEHGPKGGDELNNIIEGKNYGWPFYSYGFSYDNRDIHRRPHKKPFQEPHFVFPQDTGVSEVVFYQGNEFPRWNNHFIVATMKAKSLYLLNYDELNDRIIYAEKIPIGYRVRDILISEKGIINLVTDERKIIKLSIPEKKKYKKTSKFEF